MDKLNLWVLLGHFIAYKSGLFVVIFIVEDFLICYWMAQLVYVKIIVKQGYSHREW